MKSIAELEAKVCSCTEALTAKLDAMSPLKVLTRGYAMAQNDHNELVRSVTQVKTGDQMYISLSDGILTTTVTDIKESSI